MPIRFCVYNPQQNPVVPQDTLIPSANWKEWLQDYYRIRQECFRNELGIADFDGSEDRYDRIGYTLLIIADNQCIGGVRLNESGANSSALLPLESDDFMLPDFFPELTEESSLYSQWTRLAISPECRSAELINQLAQKMSWMNSLLGHKYCFNVSGTCRQRFYRRLHGSQGHPYETRDDVTVPPRKGFEHLEHLLSISYIDKNTPSLSYCPLISTRAPMEEGILEVA